MTTDRAKTIGRRGSTARQLDALVPQLALSDLTYEPVGETWRATLPHGMHEQTRVIGHGADDLASAIDGLKQWASHRGAGLDVLQAPALQVGEVFVAVMPLVAFEVRITCRIVGVVDTPTSFGFAYGTLPVHPESGEESFVVTMEADGSIVYRIRYYSTARHPIAKLGGPVTKAMQKQFVHRYFDALTEHIATGGSSSSNSAR